MGAWGYQIFESDDDLDWADMISDEAGMNLFYPEDPDMVVGELNGGLLTRLFERYLAEDKVQKYAIVILGILAMGLGAKIEDKYLNMIRGIYQTKCGLYSEGQAQVKKALDNYKNDGTPWNIQSMSLAGKAQAASDDANSGRGFVGLNVPHGMFFGTGPPWPRKIKEPTGQRNVQDKEALHGNPRCWNCTQATAGLMICTKCKKARYCNTACQKKDWKLHKLSCVSTVAEGEVAKEKKNVINEKEGIEAKDTVMTEKKTG